MGYISTKEKEIVHGKALSSDIYDTSGKLLLSKGQIIETDVQADILLKKGVYLTKDKQKNLHALRLHLFQVQIHLNYLIMWQIG